MPIGRSRRRVLGFLRRRRDGIEADVGKEDHRRAGHDARPCIGHERRPVGRLDVPDARDQEEQHRDDLDRHHRGIEAGAFPDADDEQHHDQQDDDHRREVDHGAWRRRRRGGHPRRQAGCRSPPGCAGNSRSSRSRPSSIRRRTRGSDPSRSSTRRFRPAWRMHRCRRFPRSESSRRTPRSTARQTRTPCPRPCTKGRWRDPPGWPPRCPVSTKMPVPMIAPMPEQRQIPRGEAAAERSCHLAPRRSPTARSIWSSAGSSPCALPAAIIG